MNESITSTAVAMVIAAAALHAGWNYLAKRSPDRLEFIYLLTLALPLYLLPPCAVQVLRGATVPAGALLASLATSLLWVVYYEALAVALQRGDLSVAYPVIRGSAPVGAAALGLLLGERITVAGAVGIGAIVAGVWMIGTTPGRGRARLEQLAPPLLAGLSCSVYSVIDKYGVTQTDPVVYYALCGTLTAAWLALRATWRRAWPALAATWRAEWKLALLAGAGNTGSYLLVLSAFQQANAGYVVALRATAVLFTVLAGKFALGEPALRWRLAWGLVMIAGIVLIAVAG